MDVGTGQVAAEAVALYGHIGKAGLSKEGGQGGGLKSSFHQPFLGEITITTSFRSH